MVSKRSKKSNIKTYGEKPKEEDRFGEDSPIGIVGGLGGSERAAKEVEDKEEEKAKEPLTAQLEKDIDSPEFGSGLKDLIETAQEMLCDPGLNYKGGDRQLQQSLEITKKTLQRFIDRLKALWI